MSDFFAGGCTIEYECKCQTTTALPPKQISKANRGALNDLTKAIREGKTIRIYMNLGFVEHLMDAGFMSIIGDNVYAQIHGIQAQRPDRKSNIITLRPYSRHVGFYSTKSPYEMKWYAVD